MVTCGQGLVIFEVCLWLILARCVLALLVERMR